MIDEAEITEYKSRGCDLFKCTCANEIMSVSSWYDSAYPEASNVYLCYYPIDGGHGMLSELVFRLSTAWYVLRQGTSSKCGGSIVLTPEDAKGMCQSILDHSCAALGHGMRVDADVEEEPS